MPGPLHFSEESAHMNYPDDVTQASFDRYWNDKLSDDPRLERESEARCDYTEDDFNWEDAVDFDDDFRP